MNGSEGAPEAEQRVQNATAAYWRTALVMLGLFLITNLAVLGWFVYRELERSTVLKRIDHITLQLNCAFEVGTKYPGLSQTDPEKNVRLINECIARGEHQ